MIIIDISTSSTPDILINDVNESNNRISRKYFVEELFVKNKSFFEGAGQGTKLLMSTSSFLGTSQIITNNYVRILLVDNNNVELPSGILNFNVSDLGEDEGVYLYLDDVSDVIIITTISGKKIRVEKMANNSYMVKEQYMSIEDTGTSRAEGFTNTFDNFIYSIGSLTGSSISSGSSGVSGSTVAPICFPAGTPVNTNQGLVAIEKLNPDIHTIRNKRIVAITQTRPLFTHIVSIEKDALGKNVPISTTQISKEHGVFYKGKMMRAVDLVGVCDGVVEIPYNGETLYNVLLEKHGHMMINNLICETLHPDNIMAKICGGKYNPLEQDKLCEVLTKIIKSNNLPAYKKLYASLK
jgi:hypothetical protein